MVFDAKVALTPVGKPFAPDTPLFDIPVAPVVVWVMLGEMAVFIHSVGVDEATPTVLLTFKVCVPLAGAEPALPSGEATVMLPEVVPPTIIVCPSIGVEATSIVTQKK